MLKKKNRADRKEIDLLFKQGKFFSSPNFTFKYILFPTSRTCGKPTRISFIAPKSIAKLAVQRNLLRRRGYSALKKYLDHFPLGLLGVFVFKKPQTDLSILENEIKNTLDKIN